jgi:CheY-like chemotaxis protein
MAKRSTSRAGVKVLVVDDQPINQHFLARLLELRGCVVDCVADGASAIQRAGVGNYDLVLMDLHMPDLGGLEATTAIRSSEANSGRRTFIVAVTAHSLPEYRDLCLEAGMDGYLQKPVNLAMLDDLLRTLSSRGFSKAA